MQNDGKTVRKMMKIIDWAKLKHINSKLVISMDSEVVNFNPLYTQS